MPTASRGVAQVNVVCPAARWRAASAVHLWALTCGRSARARVGGRHRRQVGVERGALDDQRRRRQVVATLHRPASVARSLSPPAGRCSPTAEARAFRCASVRVRIPPPARSMPRAGVGTRTRPDAAQRAVARSGAARGYGTGSQARTSWVTLTSALLEGDRHRARSHRPRPRQRASISASSSASSASRSCELVLQPGDLALGRLDAPAGGGRLARPPGRPAELAEQAAGRAAAAEQAAEDRAGRRQQVVAPAGVLLRLGDLGGVGRGVDLIAAAWPPWPRTCRAASAASASARSLGHLQAAGREVGGRLAGPAEQLERGVRRQLEAQAAHEVVDEVARQPAPERRLGDRCVGEAVRDRSPARRRAGRGRRSRRRPRW